MAIVFRKNNQNAHILHETAFAKEDAMQEYLINNPEIVPVYDISEDARLFVAAREFATTSGPIDALGFDENGNIYVVETKLFRNADKRTVLAQAMDYGAALWKHHTSTDDFFGQLDDYARKHFGKDFREKFCEFFELDDAELAIENIATNLQDGSIKFVVLMDKLESRLKDLITYINQNSKFDVYAVELDFYKHDEFEIIIPKLYGTEVRKDVETKTSSVQRRARWNDQSFREKVAELTPDQQRAVLAIYEWTVNHADRVVYGTGSSRASINPRFLGFNKNSFFTLYSDGQMGISFGYVDSESKRVALRDFLNQHLDFVQFDYTTEELAGQYPSISKELVYSHYEKIIAAFEKFIAKINEEMQS